MTPATIMIVEDEGVVAMHLSRTVRDWGYLVASIAATAEQAIRDAAEHLPDLVLMDIGLRGDVDGIEAATVLRERFQTPVIFLTAFTDEATLERAKTAEPYGYAVKPFNETELKITIEMALFKHRADRELRRRGDWLDTTLSKVGEAMIATDAEGNVMFINERAEELTGWPRSDAFARDVSEVLRVPDTEEIVATEHFVKRALRKHAVVSRGPGSLLLTRRGDRIPLEDCAAPIRDPDGRVSGAVVIFRDASERQRTEERLVHMAHHDALTGLANRVLFHDRLREAIAHARRSRRLVAVVLLDLDNFKFVNDTLGHAAGDALLVAAAHRVLGCVRETDTVARLGGDEIAVILPDLDDPVGARALAEKLVRVFDRPFTVNDVEVRTTASVGITVVPLDEDDPDQILRRADRAMYQAKAAGRNRYHQSPTSSAAGSTAAVEPRFSDQDLREALERSEFEVYLQPVFDLRAQRVTGAEALIRWNHPTLGVLPASEFIEAADRCGVMTSIIDLSLKGACSAATRWLRSAPGIRVSVNLSTSALERRDLVATVVSALDGQALPPEHLEIEVGERSSADPSRSRALGNLRKLRDLGVAISVDGFGREAASMLTMRTLPFASVKIDRSLIEGLPHNRQVLTIVKATMEVSESFDVSVVAVGVENDDQLTWLRTSGCHQVQGNLLGPPVPAEDFFKQYVM